MPGGDRYGSDEALDDGALEPNESERETCSPLVLRRWPFSRAKTRKAMVAKKKTRSWSLWTARNGIAPSGIPRKDRLERADEMKNTVIATQTLHESMRPVRKDALKGREQCINLSSRIASNCREFFYAISGREGTLDNGDLNLDILRGARSRNRRFLPSQTPARHRPCTSASFAAASRGL